MTLLGLIFIYGTIDLDEIVRWQSGTVLGFLPPGHCAAALCRDAVPDCGDRREQAHSVRPAEAESELIAGTSPSTAA